MTDVSSKGKLPRIGQSKQKAEKHKISTSSAVASATATVTTAKQQLVAGKLKYDHWSFMIDSDDGDHFGAELVDELLNLVLKQIFTRYIERQIIPYNVNQAKIDLLKIVEWQFLHKDEGETLCEANGWLEDEEVAATYTDCWAQGCVPRIPIPVSIPLVSETSMEQIREVEDEERAEGEETMTDEVMLQRHISPLLVKVQSAQDTKSCMDMEDEVEEEEEVKEVSVPRVLHASVTMPELTEVSTSDENVKSSIIEDDPLVKVTRRGTVPIGQVALKPDAGYKRYKHYKGPVSHHTLVNINQSLYDTEKELAQLDSQHSRHQLKMERIINNEMPASCHALLKLQAGRPPGHRDIVFDQDGQVVSIAKLDMRKIPSHKVKLSYQIHDPESEESHSKEKKLAHRRQRKLHHPLMDSRGNISPNMNIVKMMPAGPSALLDAIDIAPGVVIREGDKTRKGPRIRTKKQNLLNTQCLQPINSSVDPPSIAVSELMDTGRPITIRPLVASPVIPPISN